MINGDEIAERLARIIAESDTNNRKLALDAGLSPTGVRDIVMRKTKNPTFATLSKIAGALHIDVGELTGDPSNMVLVSPDEHQHMGGVSRQTEDHALIPVYDIQAAAGNGAVVDEYEAIASQLTFPVNYLRHITNTSPRDLSIISVTGASMLPTLHHDDIVMVDCTKKNIAYDGMFVIRHDDLLKVKRLRWGAGRKTIRLISDNATQHPAEEHPPQDVEVLGRVVWIGSKQP